MENVLQVVAMFNAIRLVTWIIEEAEPTDVRELVVVNRNELINAMDENMLTVASVNIAIKIRQCIHGSDIDDVKWQIVFYCGTNGFRSWRIATFITEAVGTHFIKVIVQIIQSGTI